MLIKAGRLQQRLPSLRLRYIIVPALIWFVTATIFLGSRHPQVRQRIFGDGSKIAHRMPPATVLQPLPERIPCYGVRDELLPDSPDDKLRYSDLSNICNRPLITSSLRTLCLLIYSIPCPIFWFATRTCHRTNMDECRRTIWPLRVW